MVTVTSSSLMSDSQPLSSLCGRLSTRCVTKPHQKSWIQINNNPMQFPIPIVPLNNMSAPQQNMQLNANANNNWRLQGSLDGGQCTVIREHQNDESLRFKGQSYSWLLRNINSSNKKLSNNKNTLMESHKYIPQPLRSKILPNATKSPLTNDKNLTKKYDKKLDDKTLYNPSLDQERPNLNSKNTETHSNITDSLIYSNNIDDEDTDNNIECDPLSPSKETPNNHNIVDTTENNNEKRDALTPKTPDSNPTRTETHVIITHSNITQTTPLSPRTAESPFQASPTPNKTLNAIIFKAILDDKTRGETLNIENKINETLQSTHSTTNTKSHSNIIINGAYSLSYHYLDATLNNLININKHINTTSTDSPNDNSNTTSTNVPNTSTNNRTT
eukprot:963989_1